MPPPRPPQQAQFALGEPGPAVPAGPRRVTLLKLSSELARAFADIGQVVVEGDVHRPTRSGGGSLFFTLKDRTAQVSVCVPSKFLRNAPRVKDGERVAVTGRLEFVHQRGQLQLEAVEVVPVGAGAIAALIAEVRARLAADGLLTRPRKPIPVLPAVIGVVCGTEAAVRRDIESVVAARFPGYPVLFLETNVSGAGAADAIVRAIDELDRRVEVEVIVLARGGGDAAQLLPFSDEGVCRAICASRTPVVSAIGHDGDKPLSDEVADLRAGTPSLAAAAVVPDRAALTALVADRYARIERVAERRLERAGVRLAAVPWRGALDRRVDQAAARLGRVAWRTALPARVDREQVRLDGLRRHLDALAPARVLARGYAVVRTADGSVVRDPSGVAPGERVHVQVARGTFAADVAVPERAAEERAGGGASDG